MILVNYKWWIYIYVFHYEYYNYLNITTSTINRHMWRNRLKMDYIYTLQFSLFRLIFRLLWLMLAPTLNWWDLWLFSMHTILRSSSWRWPRSRMQDSIEDMWRCLSSASHSILMRRSQSSSCCVGVEGLEFYQIFISKQFFIRFLLNSHTIINFKFQIYA